MEQEATSFSELRASLKPGDILIASPKPVSKNLPLHSRALATAFRSVSKAVQGDKTHSSLYVGNGKVIETRMESGIRELPLQEALKGLDAVAVRPEVGGDVRRRAVARAKELLSKKPKYDLAGVFRSLAAHLHLPVREEKKLDALHCATMLQEVYDKPLVNKPHGAALPVDFLRSKETSIVSNFKNRSRKDRE